MKRITDALEAFLDWGGTKKDIALLAVSGAALALSIAGVSPLPFDMAWVVTVLCGVPIILEAFIGLVTAFDIKADVLVSMALIASVCIGEDFAAGEVAFIMQLGGLLEELTVAKARAGIERLVRLTPVTARIITPEGERVAAAEDVRIGDRVRVLPGETIPVDGVIAAGQTSIDQSVMTGESMPVDKCEGNEVSSGTINLLGAFEMTSSKVGEDSSIQRMIRLVQSADAGKAKIVNLADRWATWIVITALTAAGITWAVSGEIIRAVTILVVFCPCALVLATPTAIMAAIGNATKYGFLVREGDALERLAGVDTVTFDKTGTLTYGTPRVTAAVCAEGGAADEDELLLTAARAEVMSEHPLGKAVVNAWRERTGAVPDAPEDFRLLLGRGVIARFDGREVYAGSAALLNEHGAEADAELSRAAEQCLDQGCTVVYVGEDGRCLGFLALSDTPRESGAATVGALTAQGITPVLLTGDNERAAGAIAAKLGITEWRAALLPEGKLDYINDRERAGHGVCMIGDGINDAPALKCATVGIAMGGVGSDIAVDAADIALVNDEIRELPHLTALAKRMMGTIKLNLTFSLTLNFVAIVLAITGVLNPVVGALVHNAGSVLVITNSALLLNWRRKK